MPEASRTEPIAVSAEAANRWQQGSYEVWLLRNCRIVQGADTAEAREAVLWIDRTEPTASEPSKVIAYLEGNVVLRLRRQGRPVAVTDQKWFGRFFTARTVEVRAGVVAGRPDVLPGIYQRGMEQRNPALSDTVRTTQAQIEQAEAAAAPPAGSEVKLTQFMAPTAQPAVVPTIPPGTRRVRIFPRGDVPLQFQWKTDPATNQWTIIFDQGVNLIVDGLDKIGSLDVSTDRLVLWTVARQQPDLSGQAPQDAQQPMEVYMEGNVVFRQGDRRIYADRMYYDVRAHLGTVLNADMLTPARSYEGLLRLHAEVLQQTGPDQFVGQDAYFTPSRLGVPRLRLQSSRITLDDHQEPMVDPVTGMPLADPVTGEPAVHHDRLATGTNDFLFIENLPIFYWPYIATDLEEPTFYLRSIQLKNDSVFGTQILTHFDMYQLLGVTRKPVGTDWDLSLDYLSQRGFGYGTTFLSHRGEFLGIDGPTSELVDFWGLHDSGHDNLGVDRPNVTPDVAYRYRFLWQHRQVLPDGWQVTAEVGSISDRNFLQEYFKREWDEMKDQSTDVELKRLYENQSLSLFAGVRLDPFFTETQWLPRGDHFLLGESILDDRLTWFEHTSLGYAQFRTASLPQPGHNDELVTRLPWEPQNVEGGRFVSRQELDLPLQLGPVRVAPYALGELGYWGEDINGQPLSRAYYQAGVRATLPMWSVDPDAECALWNVHGLAHKVEFDFEYFHSQSNRNLNQLPLYDSLDDNQIEAFRRRLVLNTFYPGLIGGPLPATLGPPLPFDERYYALRSDLGGYVTSPGMEIADTLDEIRFGIHQRWQTKRGPAEARHIVDWIELDTNVTFFPNPNRDNFGSVAGLWDYDFRWHVGDRLTLLSEGIFDFFDQGQKVMSFGAFLTRPPRGALYLGFRMIEGPTNVNSQVIQFSYSYWMSPKWISSVGLSMDLGDTKNFSQTVRVTRIGESLLASFDLSVDPVRNTVGANFMVEPRFLPKGHLGNLSGVHVPPAGAFGVE